MKKWPLLASTLVVVATALLGCKTETSGVKSDQGTDADAVAVASGVTGLQRCNTAPLSSQDPHDISYAASCQDLISRHPSIDDPQTAEDTRVLCPFLRILNRSQMLSAEIASNLTAGAASMMNLPVSIGALLNAAQEFGCSKISCGAVAMKVSSGQSGKDVLTVNDSDLIDIGRLDSAKGIAHNCGFNFAYGDVVVTDTVRVATLAMLQARAVGGHLSYDDLVATKKDMCQRDFTLSQGGSLPTINKLNNNHSTLDLTPADGIEVNLIYMYLGGFENGYILYSDVDRFFHAQMPLNKTKYLIDVSLFAHIKLALLKSML